MESPKITAIIKPTHECNLACKYCYVDENAEKGRMNPETLENMTKQLLSIPGKKIVDFLWHGGEPLLMGIDFYKKAINLQKSFKKKDQKVINSIQSNVTLMNKEFLDFFEKYSFSIGSSLDGPEKIHDLTRQYPGGRGSFKDVLKGLSMIRSRNDELRKKTKKEKCAKYLGGGMITILTRKNIDKLDKVYDFFKSKKIPMKINPLIKSGKATQGYGDLSIGADEYGKALVKLFDRWFYEKDRGIDVDPLSSILGNLMTGKPVSCNFSESCREGFISIGPQGDVYPCGRFDGIKEYRLGNINEDSLSSLLESKRNKVMVERKVESCSPCRYKKICNSGCMHNAYMVDGNINDKDYYCSSYKILFSHLEKVLGIELEKAKAS